MTTCRTCKHLSVEPDKDGKIRIRSGNYYQCSCPIPPPPPMPKSIRFTTKGSQGFGSGDMSWPIKGNWMNPDHGEGCTFHEARK